MKIMEAIKNMANRVMAKPASMVFEELLNDFQTGKITDEEAHTALKKMVMTFRSIEMGKDSAWATCETLKGDNDRLEVENANIRATLRPQTELDQREAAIKAEEERVEASTLKARADRLELDIEKKYLHRENEHLREVISMLTGRTLVEEESTIDEDGNPVRRRTEHVERAKLDQPFPVRR